MGDLPSHAELVRCLWALLYLAVVLPLPVHVDDLDALAEEPELPEWGTP